MRGKCGIYRDYRSADPAAEKQATSEIASRSNPHGAWSLRKAAITDRAVMRPVLGFSEGTFSIERANRAASLSTSMVWQFRSNRWIGPNLDHGAVRADTGERKSRRNVDVCRENQPRLLGRSPRTPALASLSPVNGYALRLKVWRATQAPRRLARDHAHGSDLTLRRGGDCIKAQQRAGRHDDLPSPRFCKLDELGAREERTG